MIDAGIRNNPWSFMPGSIAAQLLIDKRILMERKMRGVVEDMCYQ
jgi:hypothetical protein